MKKSIIEDRNREKKTGDAVHYAGPEVEGIYGKLTGDKDKYSTAKTQFATYFTPKKNVGNFQLTTSVTGLGHGFGGHKL